MKQFHIFELKVLLSTRTKDQTMHFALSPRPILFTTCLLGLLIVFPINAQEGLKRTTLHRADLSGADGMEVISSILEVQPGATIPRHFHNGIEAGMVLAGAMLMNPGMESQWLAAGTDIFQLRGALHGGATVVGDKTLKLFTVHIVDKDKPLLDGIQ